MNRLSVLLTVPFLSFSVRLSGESPFQGNTDSETLALVTAGSWEFDPEFDDLSDKAKDFISRLLKKEKRSGSDERQTELLHFLLDVTTGLGWCL